MNAITKPSAAGMVLRPQSFSELVQFAQMAAKSSMVPAQYKGQPESIMLAIQMGSELGLAPMQALQNIAVINGRPAVWGDAVVGLCRQSPICRDIIEAVTGDGDKMVATCTAVRLGAEPIVRSFSVEDAKKAGLWGKSGPWSQYPKRMLQMRARGFAVRDAFPDVLRGLITAEEAADTPPRDGFVGTTVDARPEPLDAAEPAMDPAPRKQTIADWLDALATELDAATDGPSVDAIVFREDVQKALDKLRNGALDRLQNLVTAAQSRTAQSRDSSGDEGDGWPGPDVPARASA
jgi:hypothetical protein